MRLFHLLWICAPSVLCAQQILHYSETSGFDHGTRSVSLAMFESIGLQDGFVVVDDVDGSEFNSLNLLLQYEVIVFSNTSGDAILDSLQRAHFESYVGAGGNVMGIHAASDTYRHSTANGSGTGSWDFYPETIGASVQQNPNHVAGTPSYPMSHVGLHSSTANIPDPWVKNEEYYYWLNGFFDSTNVVVLEVDETIGPNGLVNAYDSVRAMSWYRELATGSKVFYTALGHAQSNFTSDTLFRRHIRDALNWLRGTSTNTSEGELVDPGFSAHQVGGELIIRWNGHKQVDDIRVLSTDGRVLATPIHGAIVQSPQRIPVDLPTGIYIIEFRLGDQRLTKRFHWAAN